MSSRLPQITNRDIYLQMGNSPTDACVLNYLKSVFENAHIKVNEKLNAKLKNKATNFTKNYFRKLRAPSVNRSKSTFLSKHKHWLESVFDLSNVNSGTYSDIS